MKRPQSIQSKSKYGEKKTHETTCLKIWIVKEFKNYNLTMKKKHIFYVKFTSAEPEWG